MINVAPAAAGANSRACATVAPRILAGPAQRNRTVDKDTK